MGLVVEGARISEVPSVALSCRVHSEPGSALLKSTSAKSYDDAFNGQYDGKYTYDRVGFGPMEDDYGGSSDCGEDHAEDHEEQQTAEEILGDPADDIVADRRELWRMAAAGARLADGRLLADILPPTAELDPETAALQARLTQLRRDLAADAAAKAAGAAAVGARRSLNQLEFGALKRM